MNRQDRVKQQQNGMIGTNKTKEDNTMQKTMKLLSMAALALMCAVMTGCSGDDDSIVGETPQQPADKAGRVTLTTTVSLGTTTRALDADGNKSFAEGDKIAVVYTDLGGVTQRAESDPLPEGTNGQTATFTVTLDDPDRAQDVTYIYPAAMANADGTPNYDALDEQDGTLATLAASLDYCSYTGAWDNGALPSPTLTNQLAVCAFTIKDNGGNDITGTITGLTVTEGTNSYTVNRTATAGPIYVAMKPVDGGGIDFVAYDGTYFYDKSVSSKSLAAGHLYPIGVKLTKFDPSDTYLTFEAMEDNASGAVKLIFGAQYKRVAGSKSIQYSTDGGSSWSEQIISRGTFSVSLTNKGDKVIFRGNNTKMAIGTTTANVSHFSCEGNFYVYGNVMSLLSLDSYATETTFSQSFTFALLFYQNANIYNHPYKTLALPATTLSDCCYFSMFRECTNLTKAPDLPAETLAQECYEYMFYGCSNLKSIKCLATTNISETNCNYWLNGVAANGTFTKAAGATWPEAGISSIPEGWTVIEE